MLSELQTLQDRIFIWIRDRESCSVSQLVDACKRLVEPYGNNTYYTSNPIYWLVFPLLRIGILEYGIEDSEVIIFASNKMRFVLPDNRIIQCNDDKNEARFHLAIHGEEVSKLYPLLFLQSFPTMESIVETFPEYSARTESFGFCRNLFTLKTEPFYNTDSQKVGLYKQYNYPYVPYCLVMRDMQKKKVMLMGEFLDALNYASCYVLMELERPLFQYIACKKKLVVLYPALLPIFISRALIQFDPKQLLDSQFYTMSVEDYSQIPLSAIREIQRIFSETSVEVVND